MAIERASVRREVKAAASSWLGAGAAASPASAVVALDLEKRTEAFRRRFVLVISSLFLVFGVAGVFVYGGDGNVSAALSMAVTSAACLAAVSLALAQRTDAAARIFLAAFVVSGAVTLLTSVLGPFAFGTTQTLLLVGMLCPFLLPARDNVAVVGAAMVTVFVAYAKAVWLDELDAKDASLMGSGTMALIATLSGLGHLFVRHAGENLEILRARLLDIEAVMDRARRIADGDLSGEIDGEGDVPATIRAMLESLREMVKRIQQTASELASATQEIAAMARQQEESAVEQASAVEETRRTIEAMLASSREIASSARGVAENSETTLENARTIDERLATLAQHTDRIAEILDVIKDVANKSELLALNAALEGAKAGETGRGFSLVAARMQRLAEDVMSSVRDVKSLTDDIRGATRATTAATVGATRMAADTTEAAHRISAVTRDQERSTEEVTRAMNDIAAACSQTTAGTNQTLQAARDLSAMAERLEGLVARFQV